MMSVICMFSIIVVISIIIIVIVMFTVITVITTTIANIIIPLCDLPVLVDAEDGGVGRVDEPSVADK